MKRILILTALTGLLALLTTTAIAVPNKINYQGRLLDGSGNPVADNVYTLAFKIYDSPSGGVLLWSETIPVQVTEGLFTVILGNITPLNTTIISPGAALYMGVTVNLDPEISPRKELVSAAYAIQADNAALAQDLVCTGCVAASDIDETQVQRRVSGSASIGNYIQAINQDGTVTTGTDQTGGWTDDGTVVRLTSGTDDIGIGTTSPTAKLDVAGTVKATTFSGSGASLTDVDTNPNDDITSLTGGTGISISGAGNSRTISNTGDPNTADDITSLTGGTGISVSGAGNSRTITNTGDTNPSDDVTTAGGVSITGGLNIATSSGSVGIGTASPSSRLHVREDINSTATLTIENQDAGTSSQTRLQFVSEDGASGITAISVFDNSHASSPATMRLANNLTGGEIDFVTNANIRMTIENDGQVGIGTTLPTSPLHVVTTGSDAGVFDNNSVAGAATGLWGYANGAGGSFHYGVVGVANGATTNYAVYASGDIAYTGILIDISDAKFKEDVEDFSGALSRIMQVKPRSFRFKSGGEYDRFSFSAGKHFGFVAQELEEVFPELVVNAYHPVNPDAQDLGVSEQIEYKAIKKLELIPILLQAIQEQQRQIEELQSRIGVLEKK